MTSENSETEEEKAEPKHEDEGELLEVNFVNDRRFWIGLGVPMAPPAVVFLLALTGILDGNSSPAIMGIIYFMCSLCLWPIIGFGIAMSRNTFVETFRAGASFCNPLVDHCNAVLDGVFQLDEWRNHKLRREGASPSLHNGRDK